MSPVLCPGKVKEIVPYTVSENKNVEISCDRKCTCMKCKLSWRIASFLGTTACTHTGNSIAMQILF